MNPKCLLLFALLSSCAARPRGWRGVQSTAGDPVSGSWAGEWVSKTNGHRGDLQCVVERKSDETWEFRYRAEWARLFSARFTLDSTVRSSGRDRWLVQSEKNLGPVFGGTFRSSGEVRGDTFSSTYESQMDRGEMILRLVR